MTLQVISANVMGIGFGAAILTVGYRLGKKDGSYLENILICLVGGLVGWLLGVLASPINSDEGIRFNAYAGILSAFFSGYVVSKLDRFLEKSLFQEKEPNRLGWLRLALFTAALLSVLIPTFANRSYHHSKNQNPDQKIEKPDSDMASPSSPNE